MTTYRRFLIAAGRSDQTASLLKRGASLKPAWQIALEVRAALESETGPRLIRIGAELPQPE